LNDQTFLSKAPEKVVASLRAKVADYREQLAKNKNLLDNLS
jgi:valyl-tRNA synthetase